MERRRPRDQLGLTDQQRQQIEKTWTEYGDKFKELATQKPEAGEKQFHQLKREMCAAISRDLSDEELIRLPAVLREEFHQWRQPEYQRQHVQAIENKLALSPAQKGDADKIIADCERKTEKPINQLKELHQQENAAIEKVLNDEQRTKLNQILKSRGRNQ